MAAGEPGNREASDRRALTLPGGRPRRVACRESEFLACVWAPETDGAARRPELSFPPCPAPLAHASLTGCRPPHSPLSHRRPPPFPALLPADSLARTLLELPLADWLRRSGPGDVISETWQPGESAPHGGGGGKGQRRSRLPTAVGGGVASGVGRGEEREAETPSTAGVRRRGGWEAGAHSGLALPPARLLLA